VKPARRRGRLLVWLIVLVVTIAGIVAYRYFSPPAG